MTHHKTTGTAATPAALHPAGPREHAVGQRTPLIDGIEKVTGRARYTADLPFGEDEEVIRVLLEHGLAVIPLIAPTTLPERRAEICAAARGFVYVVSTVGTTGESKSLPADLTELVGHAKAEATAPVAVIPKVPIPTTPIRGMAIRLSSCLRRNTPLSGVRVSRLITVRRPFPRQGSLVLHR